MYLYFPHFVWLGNHFFIHLPVDRCWNSFYAFTIVNGAEMNTGMWASLQTVGFVSFVYIHKQHFRGHNSSILTF